MKLSIPHLFEVAGFDCTRLEGSPGDIRRHAARCVFVTEETVAAFRDSAGHASRDIPSWMDVSFGDLFVRWTEPDGRIQGRRCKVGQDAGLVLPLPWEGGREVPFTGAAMFDAWAMLSEMNRSGVVLDLNRSRLLFSIDGLFRMIRGYPDPARFPEQVIGSAYRAAITGRSPSALCDLPDGRLARACIARTLRARIGKADPLHPDALSACAGHHEVLARMGARTVSGQPRRGPSEADGIDGRLTRAITALLPHLTTADPDRAPVTLLGPPESSLVRERIAPHVLTGGWVDAVRDSILDGLGPRAPDVLLAASGGRDILALVATGHAPEMIVTSWPTHQRRALLSLQGRDFVAFSPEETPDRQEIDRLGQALSAIQSRPFIEAPMANDRTS